MSGPADAALRSTFIEASAGTGKTRELVNGIVDAIVAGVPVDRIVAVTFTHAAAGEMKLRVRQKLDEARTAHGDAASHALQTLDRAFIGTIHSFCAHLLRQFPVEASVDPEFAELSQGEAFRLFSSVFRRWIEEKLANPSASLRRALVRLSSDDETRDPLDTLRRSAWDLAEWRDYPARWEKRPFHREEALQALIEQGRAVLASWRGGKRQPLDELLAHVDAATLAGALDRDAVEAQLLRLPWAMQRLNWNRPVDAGRAWDELTAGIDAYRRQAEANFAAEIRDDLYEAVVRYESAKRSAGQLDFLDLLIAARNLLANDSARAALQSRYDRIFIDEFQDTDPLQAEILLLLSAADTTERDWRTAAPAPGKLFAVGDPKQSIYRFRRADAALYGVVRDRLTASGVEGKRLNISHRSNDAIQSFVNAAFEPCIPEYLALEGGEPASVTQPAVVALPMPQPYGARDLTKTAINKCSPDAVAAYVEWLLRSSNWTVRDPATKGRVEIRPEHVCILFRRFTNSGVDLTQEYVRCLEARGVEHVLVGSKSFHQREEVGVIRTALRAVEWPDDELSVFAVLRGSLFSISDGTLLKFQSEFRRFSPFVDLPEDLDDEFEPVRDALQLLSELHRQRNRRPIAATINALLDHTRAHATFAFRKGGERVLANVSRLLDLARSFEVEGATSFRSFVDYLEEEFTAGETAEAPVLEQQAGGVKLMTVHRAKGLEFPVVILADLTANLAGRECSRYVDPERRLCAQRLLFCSPHELLDHADEELAADEAEGVRLAYVAATRATDLLVVSAVGEAPWKGSWLSPLWDALYPPADQARFSAPAPGCPPFGATTILNRPAEMREETSVRPGVHLSKAGVTVTWFDPAALDLYRSGDEGLDREELLQGTPEQVQRGLEAHRGWKASRDAAIDGASAPRWDVERISEMPARGDAAHMPVEIISIDALGVRPSGRAFGKLVHAVLQSARDAEECKAAAAVHARRLRLSPDDAKAAAEAARHTLHHPVLRDLARMRQYREFPVVVRLDDGTLAEGAIDLACTDDTSWTVIDYKTDIGTQSRYRRQVQLYGLALQRATDLPVRCLIVEV